MGVSTISREMVEDIIALTPLQEGMLLYFLKNPSSDQYFSQLSIGISGAIDVERFEKAIHLVVRHNEMLRVFYRWEGINNPVQIVLKEHTVDFRYEDQSHHKETSVKDYMEQLRKKDRSEKFNLEEVPFRVTLYKLEHTKFEMILSFHHILFDGWSTGILLKEIFAIYEGLLVGSEIKIESKNKYKEYVKFIQNNDRKRESYSFWKRYLKDLHTKTNLPQVNKKVQSPLTTHGDYYVTLSNDKVSELNNFISRNNITLASLLYTAWGILLQKYNNSHDVLFGTTVSGRSSNIHAVENMVGLFINTIPLRFNSNREMTIRQALEQVLDGIQSRIEYQSTSLVEIIQCCESFQGEELFNSIVVVENYPLEKSLTDGQGPLTIASVEMKERTNYDLSVNVMLYDGMDIHFEYVSELFDESIIAKMAAHYTKIISDMISNPDSKVSQMKIVDDEELQLLHDFNNTSQPYDKSKVLHELFSERAHLNPQQAAVVYRDQQLSYGELELKSNILASKLIDEGVHLEDIVCIMVEPSLDVYVGLLAILKTGAAFLPISSDYPESRIKYIMNHSHPKVMIVQEHWRDKVLSLGYKGGVIVISDDLYKESDLEKGKVRKVDPSNLAYIMYTSGSSGIPKAVMIEHRNVINLINWFAQEFSVQEGTKILQLTDYTFDPSIEDIFGSLLFGATIHVADKQLIYDKRQFSQYMNVHEINIINYIPTMIKELLLDNKEKFNSLRIVISGGEVLEEAVKDAIISRGYTLYNNYGPTEVTVDALFSKCSANKVTLGKPISNAKAYVLDRDLNMMPIEMVGKLYIGGAGIARGYMNDEPLTAEKFIKSPFCENERLYDTGDLARWNSDGEIEFLGRVDEQIKIMGHRVELGEVDAVLLQCDHVHEAKVITKKDKNNNNFLYAYITLKQDLNEFTNSEMITLVKESARKLLPRYMVPTEIAIIDKMPLTFNGKIDRKALEKMEIKIERKANTAEPQNEIEQAITDIWKEVLEIESISTDDDFFYIGGNSLALIRIYSLMNNQLPVKVTVQHLFDYRTIKSLSDLIITQMQPQASSANVINKIDF